MTTKKNNSPNIFLFTALIAASWIGCSRDIDELRTATFPTTAEVFIDGFSSGLNYAAFGGSKVTAFDVDEDEQYAGSASMIFAVPDAQDPEGSYAGGVFYTTVGRDLSGYNALTFWAKASQAATIDVIGFGNDLAASKYQVALQNVPVNTNWKKYFIPFPDASKLIEEKGMLFYSEAPENGLGYTFWIDEVKFEKLGSIAHARPGILNGEGQTITAETGDVLQIGDLFTDFNLPSGVDQREVVAPAYFTFSSSNSSVATVNSSGSVTVLDSGQAVISAAIGNLKASGSLMIKSTGLPIAPPTPAPVPAISADSVICMFSNAYTNVPIDTWNTRWEFSTAEDADISVDGDDIKRYKMLNFVGIEFSSNSIDASEMTHFHLDLWTPDATDPPAVFKVLLIDFGADGSFGGGDDASHELSFNAPLLQTEDWVSIDVPLSNFAGLITRGHLAQMVLSGDLANIFIDNVYFYQAGTIANTGPEDPAPTPMDEPGNVISVFSDQYPNIEGTDFNPNWGQATVVSEKSINGNNTLVYQGLNYQGIQLGNSQDITGMTHLHLDYWTTNSSLLNAFLISTGPVEKAEALTVPTEGWMSLDIPLVNFDPVNLTDLIQFKFDGNGDIYLDNIYFFKENSGDTSPSEAAPSPNQEATNVISVFSDAYTNLTGTDFNPNWGQATVVTEESIEGNNTLVYTSLNYQGIQLANAQNVSEMNFLHLDFWTTTSNMLEVFLISTGPAETAKALIVPTIGWMSIDIPLADFASVNLADLIQFKFVGNGKVYLDNIFFYKEGDSAGGIPSEAAPLPGHDTADVISVFSDAYPNIAGTDFNPNWGQATVVTEAQIEGNNTLLYTDLNYQGIQLGSTQDLRGMTHLHLDFWTDNSPALNVFLISEGPVETPYGLLVPTEGWTSLEIPLSDFSPVDLAKIIQFKFDGEGDIYLDNIYFHK